MNVKKELKKIEAQQKESHEERMARCIPIAKKILNLIGTEDIIIGDINNPDGSITEEANKRFIDITGKVLETMKEANMLYADKEFVFNLALQGLEQVKEKAISSLEQSFDVVLNAYFKKDFMDVSMEDLDAKMRESLEKK